jgi:hypothetical protein
MLAAGLYAGMTLGCAGATYHVHPVLGDNSNAGTSPQAPLRTLNQAGRLRLQAGDRLLLAAGQTFTGQLALEGVVGTAVKPVVISSYEPAAEAQGAAAEIDARGCVAGVFLKNCAQVEVANLRITGNGGRANPTPLPLKGDMRCGVLVLTDRPGEYAGFSLSNLVVGNVFFHDPGFTHSPEEVRSANGTQNYGWGIRFINTASEAVMKDISVRDCSIENVSHTGLKFTADSNGLQNVSVQGVRIANTGGPGVQMSGVRHGHFRHLDVNRSGSTNDTRNWGRGSGLWTWGTTDVIIEKSRFQNANGPGDSAGVHIDFNCRNVIVQYNLSANNAGGFCEVLGNNFNCAYRYNVSVNDGYRVKGVNGAFQEGKTFWLSGYTGDKSPRHGPFNTYFYNNTIYVGSEFTAKFSIAPTAEGLLIANNVFYIRGSSRLVAGDQLRQDLLSTAPIPNVVFSNNLYLKPENWPASLSIQDEAPLVGDPQFRAPGGLKVEDYVPRNAQLVRSRGVQIPRIAGDPVGLTGGLKMERDILGRQIVGAPDLGAVELAEEPTPPSD